MSYRDALALVREIWGPLAISVEHFSDGLTVVVAGSLSLADVVAFTERLGICLEQVEIVAVSTGRSSVTIDTPNPEVCQGTGVNWVP